MVFRHSANDFLLTAAEPNLGYLSDLIGRLDVTIEDVTDEYGMLAVQGPRSREILAKVAPGIEELAYFEHTETKIGNAPVTISRTGYTGDLGYEVRVARDEALDVLDAVMEAGEGHGFRPFGEEALLMTRIEAGLVLINVEFSVEPVRLHRPRPHHAQGARLRLDAQGHRRRDRPFIGRDAHAPRARRQDLALGHGGPRPRLGRLRPGLQRGRPHPAQGRDAAGLRVDALRRRRRAGRLRHQPDVLPGPAAAHRDGAGPTRPRRRPARG